MHLILMEYNFYLANYLVFYFVPNENDLARGLTLEGF